MSSKLKLTTTKKGNTITKTLSVNAGYVVKQLVYKYNKNKKTIISYKTRKYKIEYGTLKNKHTQCKFYGPTSVEQYVTISTSVGYDEKLECNLMILRHSKADNKHYVSLPLDSENVIIVTNTGEIFIKRIANLYRRLPNDSRIQIVNGNRFLVISIEENGSEQFELPLSAESKMFIQLRYTNLEYDIETVNSLRLPVLSNLLFLK